MSFLYLRRISCYPNTNYGRNIGGYSTARRRPSIIQQNKLILMYIFHLTDWILK